MGKGEGMGEERKKRKTEERKERTVVFLLYDLNLFDQEQVDCPHLKSFMFCFVLFVETGTHIVAHTSLEFTM